MVSTGGSEWAHDFSPEIQVVAVAVVVVVDKTTHSHISLWQPPRPDSHFLAVDNRSSTHDWDFQSGLHKMAVEGNKTIHKMIAAEGKKTIYKHPQKIVPLVLGRHVHVHNRC